MANPISDRENQTGSVEAAKSPSKRSIVSEEHKRDMEDSKTNHSNQDNDAPKRKKSRTETD